MSRLEAIVLGLCIGACVPFPAIALEFGVYNGYSGYQDFRSGPNAFYVAYHGARSDNMVDVEAAWKQRVAQLCASEGAAHFIELKYPAEPVLRDDPQFFSEVDGFRSGFRMVKGGGMVFIPIFTGSPAPFFIDAPSKMASVRCIPGAAQVRDTSRLLRVVDYPVSAKPSR
jgi:hypothetical protein